MNEGIGIAKDGYGFGCEGWEGREGWDLKDGIGLGLPTI